MKSRIKDLMIFIALSALTAVSVSNFMLITSNLDVKSRGLQRAENYFPIESFVMVTQSLVTFQEICNQEGDDCLPIPVPDLEMSGTGSGSIVGERDGKSLVLTAGHVCVSGVDGIPMIQDLSAQYSITLETGFGKTGEGTIISLDLVNDLCLLVSDTKLGPPLTVYDGEPALHEKVYNMASPQGLAAPVAVPVFDGYFSGQVASFYIFTLPAAPGSSGSPVMNANQEIVSVINAAAVSFDEYAIGCKTQAIRNFLLAAGVF